MQCYSFLGYNTDIKIAGNLVTIRQYDKNQQWAYQVDKPTSDPPAKTPEQIEKEKQERFIKSIRRAREQVFDLVACNAGRHQDYEGKKQTVKFLTLTFKENVTDIEKANTEFTLFMKRLSYHAYGVNRNVIKYIAVPELQKRGAWHYHIVLFNLKYIPWENYLEIWNNGAVYINALRPGADETEVAKYITKYISKAMGATPGEQHLTYQLYKERGLENRKRYLVSRGLLRPWMIRVETGKKGLQRLKEFLEANKKKNTTPFYAFYRNDHRGGIRVMAVELPQKALQLFKKISTSYFKNTVNRYKQQYKIPWKKLAGIVEWMYQQEILWDLKRGYI